MSEAMGDRSRWVYLYDATPWTPDWQPDSHPCQECGTTVPVAAFPEGQMTDASLICPGCGAQATMRRYRDASGLVSFWLQRRELLAQGEVGAEDEDKGEGEFHVNVIHA